MQPAYMRSVSFLEKFTSGSRISASRSDLLKLPNNVATTEHTRANTKASKYQNDTQSIDQ